MTTREPLHEHLGKFTRMYKTGKLWYYTGNDLIMDREEAVRYCEEERPGYQDVKKINETDVYQVVLPDITKEEIVSLLTERNLQVTDVIDCIIELNGYIGVGLISLADHLRDHIYSKMKNRPFEGD